MSQRETTQVTATAESTIETTPDALGHLLGGSADLGPGSASQVDRLGTALL